MLETTVQIATTLRMAGEVITFAERSYPPVEPETEPTIVPSYEIKAIPGDTVYNIQNYDSIYDIDSQAIVFRTSSAIVVSNNILKDDLFTYIMSNDPTTTYNFKVLSVVPDTTGWVTMRAAILGVTYV